MYIHIKTISFSTAVYALPQRSEFDSFVVLFFLKWAKLTKHPVKKPQMLLYSYILHSL